STPDLPSVPPRRSSDLTLPTGGGQPGWQLAVSPDGKTLAVPWTPKTDPELENALEPDPLDLLQPRVSLIDLAGHAPPRSINDTRSEEHTSELQSREKLV